MDNQTLRTVHNMEDPFDGIEEVKEIREMFEEDPEDILDAEIEKQALEYIATGKKPKANIEKVKAVANDILNGKHFK